MGDDVWYITTNPLMSDPARIWKAWFQPGSWVEYYPVEETVQWLQWVAWQNNTFGYHLTNVLLDCASALLFWRLLHKLGVRLAWVGGLLFAVHPMTVDSVALINELKASLSLPPFLLAMCAWVDYEQSQRPRDYVLALFFFVLAMLCKITMAMFPFVLLLFAWWKRGRIGLRDLKASAPFFAASLILGLLTIHASQVYSGEDPSRIGDIPRGDAPWRFVLSGQTIAFYFSRCFLPVAPTPIYPQWEVNPGSPFSYLPWLVMVALGILLWRKRETWGRHAALGLGFFVIMLAPFWGLHWISYMNATWVLEHLLYLPMLGVIGLTAAGLGDLQTKLTPRLRPLVPALVTLVVVLLAWESHVYAGIFKDETTGARYALRFNPNSTLLHNNLGVALARNGHFPEAIAEFETALRINPDTVNGHQNLGNAYYQEGRIDEAIAQHRAALKLWPDSPNTLCCLGDDLRRAGRMPEAIDAYKKAVQLQSDSAWMHFNLGLVLRHNNQIPEAIEEYRKALALNPKYAEAFNSLGIALYSSGNVAEARKQFQAALVINPGYIDARNNLAQIEAAGAQGNR